MMPYYTLGRGVRIRAGFESTDGILPAQTCEIIILAIYCFILWVSTPYVVGAL